jgi:autoinducer 2 (AI-2) kinase
MRAIRVPAGGTATTIAVEQWKMFTPDDGSSFARELDAAHAETALALLIDQAASAGETYAGIAITGQREGVVFLDANDNAVLVSPNVDGRAASEGMTIDERHGDAVYAVTGHLPALMQASAKLAWLRAQRPAAAESVRGVVPLVDWLALLLTGRRAASSSLANEIGLSHVRTSEVAVDLLSSVGFDASLVPPVVADGSVSGCVRSGPLSGRPVVLAGGDTQCALAGMGCVPSGTGVSAGWSAPVQVVTDAPVFDPQKRTWTGRHVFPERWVLESNAGECGRAWAWLVEIMSLSYDDAERLAATSPPGARDALAVLGPREMRASGMTIGTGAVTFPLPLVMSAPDRGDVLRSALEATAYAIRANVEQLDVIAGVAGARLALGGGMSRSPLFARILCDVVGRPVDVAASAETSALGAAAVASPALGLHATIEEAAESFANARRTFEPRMKVSAVYDDCYARWHETVRVFEQELP